MLQPAAWVGTGPWAWLWQGVFWRDVRGGALGSCFTAPVPGSPGTGVEQSGRCTPSQSRSSYCRLTSVLLAGKVGCEKPALRLPLPAFPVGFLRAEQRDHAYGHKQRAETRGRAGRDSLHSRPTGFHAFLENEGPEDAGCSAPGAFAASQEKAVLGKAGRPDLSQVTELLLLDTAELSSACDSSHLPGLE